jgi:recombination protein U
MELKTTLGSLSYWKEEFEDKTKKQSFDIKRHQILGLRNASKYKNTICGFIINFRKVNKTFFLSINQFDEMIKGLNKKSFNLDDTIQAGAILIEQTIKRTHYKYNIDKFINDMAEK